MGIPRITARQLQSANGVIIIYWRVKRLIGPIGSMKVRHLDVFQDRRHGFVCKTPDITDTVSPRSAHSCEPLDNTCYFGIASRLRNHLLGHVVKGYREVPDVSRDATEDLTDCRRGQIHRVAFPY